MSIYADIQNDVSSLIAGLSMTPTPTISVRKVMQVFEQDLPAIRMAPLFVIVVHRQNDDFESFEGQINLSYRVWIGIYYLGNQTYETGFDLASTRDSVRQVLHVPQLPSASLSSDPCGVWDADVNMHPDIYDEESVRTYNLDFSPIELIYKSAELRNAEIG